MNGYAYQLGATGNRTGATEPGGRTLGWQYDGIYRLTQETISLDPHSNNGTVSYGLDPVGNRLSQQATLSAIASIPSLSYDANDRVSTEQYDSNAARSNPVPAFRLRLRERLKSMTMNGNTVTIIYDGDGNRVVKTANGVTTRYLVDDLNPTGYAQVVENSPALR